MAKILEFESKADKRSPLEYFSKCLFDEFSKRSEHPEEMEIRLVDQTGTCYNVIGARLDPKENVAYLEFYREQKG